MAPSGPVLCALKRPTRQIVPEEWQVSMAPSGPVLCAPEAMAQLNEKYRQRVSMAPSGPVLCAHVDVVIVPFPLLQGFNGPFWACAVRTRKL